jgi:hypothetical protein
LNEKLVLTQWISRPAPGKICQDRFGAAKVGKSAEDNRFFLPVEPIGSNQLRSKLPEDLQQAPSNPREGLFL